MDQYKARILGYIEFRTAAIYHADKSILDQIEKQFDRFLREIGITRIDALHYFHLAPPSCRRDMAMLGVIQRSVLGKGPEQVRKYFVPVETSNHMNGRNCKRRHGMQLQSIRHGKFLEVTGRSILGLIDIYNLLPQEFIDETNVHEFQRKLQALLKTHAENNDLEWEMLFSPRVPLHSHPLRRMLNGVASTDDNVDGTMACDRTNDGVRGDGNVATNLDVPPAWW